MIRSVPSAAKSRTCFVVIMDGLKAVPFNGLPNTEASFSRPFGTTTRGSFQTQDYVLGYFQTSLRD